MGWFSRWFQTQPPEPPHHITLSKFLTDALDTEIRILKRYEVAAYEIWDMGRGLLIDTVPPDVVRNAKFTGGSQPWRPLLRVLGRYHDLIEIWEGRKCVVWA